MSKLLSSEITRLKRNKIFWLCTAVIFIVSVRIMQIGSEPAQRESKSFEYCFFVLGPSISLFFSVFISMFMGAEHSCGTIRNKLIIGHTRARLYFAYYLTCLSGTAIMLAAWFIGGLTGISSVGQMTVSAGEFAGLIAVTILYSAALTAIFLFIGVMSASRSASVVIQMILALVMILLSSMLYNRLCEPEQIREMVFINGQIVLGEPASNPAYIGGFLRTIYIAAVNILPSGQGILTLHTETADSVPSISSLQMISSVVIAVGFTLIGINSFGKKDLR